MTRRPRPRLCDEAGSVSVEFAAAAGPVLLVTIAVMIAAGRIMLADNVVTDAAIAAARTASLARTAIQAHQTASATARRVLTEQQLHCRSITVSVDTSSFTIPPGQPATVSVTVTCVAELTDLALPGLPGNRVLHSSFTSPLDQFRGRT
ncbi:MULTISPECIES: TadE/TadG family type IV pilus assembly protein [unclassified Crossiella]|uniref:TadE/TadG family type IV pilus assembly protein n=1 Tax=unclassified Crossiella TaxID=2620835 RepID=UPI001FFF0F70|nr:MULTISPECIES: TadE/TadG family type IV pilus assembly protein [unclassified Crossiella]MCK2243690.1 pilus assembly protein [Crossiella sp. S99.2]MCK2257549.1 pilus assembly protein [Crossiella sp. S99.1]